MLKGLKRNVDSHATAAATAIVFWSPWLLLILALLEVSYAK